MRVVHRPHLVDHEQQFLLLCLNSLCGIINISYDGEIMGRTDRFREDHSTFLKQVTQINSYLSDEDKVKNSAAEIRTILSQLAGAVRLHLATEDQTLYPALAKSSDATVARMARSFQVEMGGIKQAFDDYSKKWATPASIQANPKDFIKETKSLFDVLGKRINRENNELYVAADNLDL